jgi:hypothetical protein
MYGSGKGGYLWHKSRTAPTVGASRVKKRNIPSTALRVNSEAYLPSTALRTGIEQGMSNFEVKVVRNLDCRQTSIAPYLL